MSNDEHARVGDPRFRMFLLGFYLAWCLRVVLILPLESRVNVEWLRQCSSLSLRLALMALPVFLYVAYLDQQRPIAYLKLNALPRGRRLWLGAGIIVAYLTACVVFGCVFQGGRLAKAFEFTGPQWLGLVVFTSGIAFSEEVLFRGFVLQKLRLTHSFHRANAMTAGLFLLIHVPGWLYMQGPNWGLLRLSGTILIIGWVLGFLFERTGSLWPPIVLHFLNNVVAALNLP